ncbi:MAG: DNA polymerase I [Verrucomicrobiales bacterium]|nr:DNA polymerase I [Verrucomicrobiales bacterium]
MKRLFLLDGMALVYRAHFALMRNPIVTSAGLNTSAVHGFANTLLYLIKRREPTHLAVVFDTSAPTVRHERYPAYKAQRDAMPEELQVAIPIVKKMLQAFNIPVIERDGFEADDIIGTLAAVAEKSGDFETFMVTPDKDFAQLVAPRTFMYKPGRKGGDDEVLGVTEICEQWQIQDPSQVIDILGLWGDASDNIPGVPGIGEKTAKKLVALYGGVEGLLAHTDELKGKQKENVVNFAEQARLSRELATIIVDVPLELGPDDLILRERDDAALQKLFVELEFNTLGRRLFGKDFQAGRGFDSKADGKDESEEGVVAVNLKTLQEVEHSYRNIAADDKSGRAEFIADLSQQKSFCFDTETSGLNVKDTQLLGIAFSWKAHEGVYLEMPLVDQAMAEVLQELREVFENPASEKIGHHLKFDLAVLKWKGLVVAGTLFDTMLAHTLLDPDQGHQMDKVSEQLLGYTPVSIESLIGAKADKGGQLSMLDIVEEKSEEIAEYAAEDADVTWQLAEILRERLKSSGQETVFYEIESPLTPVLVAMEAEGIALDVVVLKKIGVQLGMQIDSLREQISTAAGRDFNLNSPKQLGEVLFDELKLLEKPKKTKTGQYKTDEKVLSSLATDHEIVRDILEYREATKLKNTYVDTLPEAIFVKTGRVHTTFLQMMTATGRLSSNHPNLQNIPIRTEQGRAIRGAFIARDDEHCLLAADYSQIELRVMASLSGDPAMTEAFQQGLDIHTATAARVFGVELDEVDSEMRRTAKMVNFGIIYGISAFGLSQRLGIARREASEIIEQYFKQYAGVKIFMEQTVETARDLGYVETLSGRRRLLPGINDRNALVRSAAERTAINTPIQGTAADMIKLAMVKVAKTLREQGLQTRMVLQVHDELVFDLLRSEEQQVRQVVESSMKIALPLKVPIVVETGVGESWLEAH